MVFNGSTTSSRLVSKLADRTPRTPLRTLKFWRRKSGFRTLANYCWKARNKGNAWSTSHLAPWISCASLCRRMFVQVFTRLSLPALLQFPVRSYFNLRNVFVSMMYSQINAAMIDVRVQIQKIFIFLELRVDIKEGNFALSRVFFENSREKLGMMEVIKFRRLYERRWFGSFKARSSSAE